MYGEGRLVGSANPATGLSSSVLVVAHAVELEASEEMNLWQNGK